MIKNNNTAKPFLKWAGGKTQLLPAIEQKLPVELKQGKINHYVEPFLGAGAVFFYVAQHYPVDRYYLSDINPLLILVYQTIKNKVSELIEKLQEYQQTYDLCPQIDRTELFLTYRTAFNKLAISENTAIEKSALFIFLNKTCFNGLFRLNSKGEFNVPYGKYKTALICDENNLINVSLLLQKAEIFCCDYPHCEQFIDNNSFVYFDPPYRPISTTSSFNQYTGQFFGDKEQLALAQFYHKISVAKQAKLLLSNSDPQNENISDLFFEQAYSPYSIQKVTANRAINSKGDKRGKITELLIQNYQYERVLEQHF